MPFCLFVASCVDEPSPAQPRDSGPPPDFGVPADAPEFFNGCRALREPITEPTTDTWHNWAKDEWFAHFCIRCHSSTLSGDARNGAPVGLNWDQESSVYGTSTIGAPPMEVPNLDRIRAAAAIYNYMPFLPGTGPEDPVPTCAERRRLAIWIDNGAPVGTPP